MAASVTSLSQLPLVARDLSQWRVKPLGAERINVLNDHIELASTAQQVQPKDEIGVGILGVGHVLGLKLVHLLQYVSATRHGGGSGFALEVVADPRRLQVPPRCNLCVPSLLGKEGVGTVLLCHCPKPLVRTGLAVALRGDVGLAKVLR